jgi:hypothetical protein
MTIYFECFIGPDLSLPKISYSLPGLLQYASLSPIYIYILYQRQMKDGFQALFARVYIPREEILFQAFSEETERDEDKLNKKGKRDMTPPSEGRPAILFCFDEARGLLSPSDLTIPTIYQWRANHSPCPHC